jgi:FkbM family methyltransferase
VFFSPAELSKWWEIKPTGVVHVGAHLAEEAEVYSASSWGRVVWIEAQRDLVRKLETRIDLVKDRIICAAVWDKSGVELNLNISSNSQSTSLLSFGPESKENKRIKMIAKEIVITNTLNDLLANDTDYNFINLDIQGVELKALIGLGERLSEFDYVYSEVNSKYVYENCSLLHELDSYLDDFGFKRVATRWRLLKHWGDAIYVKKNVKYSRLTRIVQSSLNLKFYFLQCISRAMKYRIHFHL